MKPSDVYVGAIDLFAILLPGAIVTSVLASTAVPENLAKAGLLLLPSNDSAARWVTFSLAAYALGHFVFLVSATLDNVYDVYRRWRWPDKSGNAYEVATQLRREELKKKAADASMNTFSWAMSVLLLERPQAAAAVQRFEADSKFFRSLFVVLVILAIVTVLKGPTYPILCLAFAMLAFLRYAERRYKSTEWAYRYAIVLANRPASPKVGQESRNKEQPE